MCQRLLRPICTWFTPERSRLLTLFGTYLVICCNFFLGGFEYGVIFPTALDYLGSLGADEDRQQTYFALLIVSYGLANIAGGYLGGLWADAYLQTRTLMTAAVVPQIIGNGLYYFASSPQQLVLSRALSGFGSGANTAMLAEVSRSTGLSHRTSIIGVISFTRQLGIVIGPAIGAHLDSLPEVFLHKSTLLNAPGYMMAICYVFYLLLLTLFYDDLAEVEEVDVEEGIRSQHPPAVPEEPEDEVDEKERLLPEAKPSNPYPKYYESLTKTGYRTPQETPSSSTISSGRTASPAAQPPPPAGDAVDRPLEGPYSAALETSDPGQSGCTRPQSSSTPTPWKEVISIPLAVLLMANFTAYLAQSSLEAALPALVERDLGLKIVDTGSIFSVGAGAQCLVLACVVLTRYFPSLRDHILIIAGLLLMSAAHVYLAITLQQLRSEDLTEHLRASDVGRKWTETSTAFPEAGTAFPKPWKDRWNGPDTAWKDKGPSWTDTRPAWRKTTVNDFMKWTEMGRRAATNATTTSRPPVRPADPYWFWMVLMGSGLQFLGYPLVNSVVWSFFSKLLSRSAQGLGAAALRLSLCLGLMLGPMWGSGLFRQELVLMLFPLVLLIASLLAVVILQARGIFLARLRNTAQRDRALPHQRIRTISSLSHACDVHHTEHT